MEKSNWLSILPSSFKWAICAYVLLSSLGFGVAGVMSYQRYHFKHDQTIQYYLGDPAEGEAAFKKPYSQLIEVTHVHAYTMPLVFFVMWILLQGTATKQSLKKFLVLGGSFSVFIYNVAPYIVRKGWVDGVWMFTIGGVGLYLFYFWPSILVLCELTKGEKNVSKS